MWGSDLQHQIVENESSLFVFSRSFALGAMLVTSVVMSFNGLIVRNIEAAGPWQINIYRSIAFIITILIIYKIQRRWQFKRLGKIKAVSKIEPAAIWAGLCLGVTGISITQALTSTTIANAMFILSITPFVTMIMAYIFLKELISRVSVVAMSVAAIGIVIMVSDARGTSSAFGNIMAAITTLGFAGFTTILRANRDLDMLPSLIIGGLIVIAASIVPSIGSFAISFHDLALCILWGAVLSGLAHWAIVASSLYLNAAELTLFMLFEFALGPVWVWQFSGESPSFTALLGGLVVISSVAIKVLLDLRANNFKK